MKKLVFIACLLVVTLGVGASDYAETWNSYSPLQKEAVVFGFCHGVCLPWIIASITGANEMTSIIDEVYDVLQRFGGGLVQYLDQVYNQPDHAFDQYPPAALIFAWYRIMIKEHNLPYQDPGPFSHS